MLLSSSFPLMNEHTTNQLMLGQAEFLSELCLFLPVRRLSKYQ